MSADGAQAPGRLVSLRSALDGTEVPLLRPGVPSFLGLPLITSAAELRAADVAVVGIPAAAQVSPGRPPGQWSDYDLGPEDARRFSLRYGGYLPELDLDVLDRARVVDYGDVLIDPADVPGSLERTMKKTGDVLDAGCRLITLGGCVPYASYAVAGAVARATTGAVGVVSLDAHGDCMDSARGRPHTRELGAGTWQRRMWEDFPNIDIRRHAEIGMRGPRNVREMVANYRDRGARFCPAATVRARGIGAVCAEAFPGVFDGAGRTWLSLDMDVLDIGALPGWGDEAIGLPVADMIHAVHAAGRAGVDALSVQFIAPRSPSAAAVVAYAAVYLLAGWITGGHLAARRT